MGIILVVAIIAILLISMYKIFEKAGRPGWEGLIPIYNIYIMVTKIIGKPAWFFVMCLIPIVNYVFLVWTYNLLSKSFGKTEAFTVGLVLLGIVFLPIMAFSDDIQYVGPSAKEANSDIAKQIDEIGTA
jgi:magnesium-transporting ATPase (P-type)